jgi:hypothetical protein
LDLGEDGISGCSPDERTGVFVVVLDEAFDFGDQLFDVGEGTAPSHVRGVVLDEGGKQVALSLATH